MKSFLKWVSRRLKHREGLGAEDDHLLDHPDQDCLLMDGSTIYYYAGTTGVY